MIRGMCIAYIFLTDSGKISSREGGVGKSSGCRIARFVRLILKLDTIVAGMESPLRKGGRWGEQDNVRDRHGRETGTHFLVALDLSFLDGKQTTTGTFKFIREVRRTYPKRQLFDGVDTAR